MKSFLGCFFTDLICTVSERQSYVTPWLRGSFKSHWDTVVSSLRIYLPLEYNWELVFASQGMIKILKLALKCARVRASGRVINDRLSEKYFPCAEMFPLNWRTLILEYLALHDQCSLMHGLITKNMIDISCYILPLTNPPYRHPWYIIGTRKAQTEYVLSQACLTC